MVSSAGARKYNLNFFLASVIWVMLVSALTSLGMWQLRRAEEKQGLMDAYRARVSLEPLDMQQLEGTRESDLRYRRAQIHGQFDVARQFLLDNQVHHRQAGYYVLTPFLVDGSDRYFLVNRGWIPLGSSREHLPSLSEPRGARVLTGMLDRFPAVGFKLKGAEIATGGWPSVVQMLDADKIAAKLGRPVFPLQILLDESAENGYAREWRPADLMPEKSKGYAFQWFSLAAVAAGYAILWGLRRNSA
jgi:surfeit locus 1 family protein